MYQTINETNKCYYKNALQLFSRDYSFEGNIEGNLNKGLYVFGGIGVGKSSSFRILKMYMIKPKT